MSEQEIVIRVRNLTKKYKLYDKPIDRLKEVLHPFRKVFHREFAALEGVSFDVKKGQTIGIIGKNGSGKSTLLKIISGVLAPTSGEVEVRGKVAALLELGAGFNPDLSGYENIFLMGSLMGFSQKEMSCRIQDIIAFAEIGEFVFQPVKMYSSGMFARLAFAVAINVDPTVLIVDEALSVGDINFQQKCIERIRKMLEGGLTFIFISHDVGALKSICENALWLNNGKLVEQGDIGRLSDNYIQSFLGDVKISDSIFESKLSADVSISKVKFLDAARREKSYFDFGERITLEVELFANKYIGEIIVAFYIKNRFATEIIGTNSAYEGVKICFKKMNEKIKLEFSFDNLLRAGEYTATLLITDKLNSNSYFDWQDGAAMFTVLEKHDEPRWCMVSLPVKLEILYDTEIF